jgi:hypothetical protein
LFSTARVARKINEEAFEGAINIIILPGSRANLLAYKKHRDPVLSDLLDKNFLIVKFRAIRGMEANPLLTRALFAEQIRSDPPEYRTSQLALF